METNNRNYYKDYFKNLSFLTSGLICILYIVTLFPFIVNNILKYTQNKEDPCGFLKVLYIQNIILFISIICFSYDIKFYKLFLCSYALKIGNLNNITFTCFYNKNIMIKRFIIMLSNLLIMIIWIYLYYNIDQDEKLIYKNNSLKSYFEEVMYFYKIQLLFYIVICIDIIYVYKKADNEIYQEIINIV